MLCIITATTYWLFLALNKPYDTSVRYPVKWIFDNENYVVVDNLPDRIRMNVHGMGWNLLRASFGLKVQPLSINLSNPAGTKRIAGISLTTEVAEELEGLELNYIIDDTLHLNIDHRTTKSFAVYIDSAGISLSPNFRITSPVRYDVDLVSLNGPSTMLNAMPADSFLVHIEEQEIDQDFDEDVPFVVNRPDLFKIDPESTHITFQVKEFQTNSLSIPVQQLHFTDRTRFTLTDSVTVVAFEVQVDLADQIVADSFAVVADARRFNPKDSTLYLQLDSVPGNIFGARLQTPQVKVVFNE